ncbi:MAG: hypothetical protein KTR29_14000 [Rhodothermaceae bacterium]|nr:hypothetical protein [Rhodothermaceae bacterium]
MYTRFSVTRINALFATIAIIAVTLLTAQTITQYSSAQEAPTPEQKQVFNQWEYKVFDLEAYSSNQTSTDKLNQEVSELQWELISTTRGNLVFRRPVKVIR